MDCPQGYIQSRTREACRIFDLKLKGKSSYRLGKLWGLLYEALPPAAELSEAMLYFLAGPLEIYLLQLSNFWGAVHLWDMTAMSKTLVQLLLAKLGEALKVHGAIPP